MEIFSLENIDVINRFFCFAACSISYFCLQNWYVLSIYLLMDVQKGSFLFTYILNHMFNNGINVIERKSFPCNCLYANVCVSKWLMEHSDDTLLWEKRPMTYLTSKVDYDQQCNSMPYICLHITQNIFIWCICTSLKGEKR